MATPAKTWTPSDPGGAPRDTPLDTAPSDTGLPFVPAPPTSHLAGFRFYDQRKYSFIRRFGPTEVKTADGRVVNPRESSRIEIRFLTKAGGRLDSEYVYYFPDHDRAAAEFERLKAAAEPGKLVPGVQAAAIACGGTYKLQGKF